MKLVATFAAAFALAAFATPALACGDKSSTTASSSSSKETVAKKGAKAAKGEAKPATAQN